MSLRICVVALVVAVGASGCRGAGDEVAPPGEELPTLDVTHWTDTTELFMEYPPLVAGQTALFAIHLTKMADFKPVSAGQAKVEFTPESGGTPTTLAGPGKPSRPGAFREIGRAHV